MKVIMKTSLLWVLTITSLSGQQINDWLVLGKNSIRQGNVELALRNYNLYIDENPQDPIGYIHRAELYSGMGRKAESELDLQIARRLNPLSLMYIEPNLRSRYSARKSYGYSFDDPDDSFAKSITKYEDYVKVLNIIKSSHAQDQVILDIIQALQEINVQKAEDLLSQLQPNEINKALYYDLAGKIALKKKDFNKAIDDFSIAIKNNPNFSIAYHNRSIAYKLIGDYDKAEEDLTRAIELNNNISLFYFSLAKLNEMMGDENSAIDHYLNAIRIDIDYSEALANYSLLLKGLGEYDEGMRFLKKAIKTEPERKENLFLKANLHFTYGEYQDALSSYEEYLQSYPRESEATFNMGLSKILLKRTEEGCNDIEKSLQLYDDYDRQTLYNMFCKP